MPVKKIITLSNFTGGLNLVKDRNDLPEGYFSRLENFYLHAGKIKPRPPMIGWPILDSTPAIMEAPLSMIALTRSTGSWDLISLGDTKLINVVQGGVSFALTDSMSLAFNLSTTLPWRTTQYKNYGYAVHPDLTTIIRFSDTNYWSTGIAAPSTNATLAAGAAGVVEAGAYYGVFTFVDADGVESAPSPVSALYNHAGALKIAWTSVDVSTNPRVTARKLYRTLPNQVGEYFYVGTIADNTTTTYTDDTTLASLGDMAPVDNLVPPTKNWVDIEVAFERLWVTDGSYLYASAPEDPDSWPAENVYAVSPDDGQPIKAIKKLGSRLLVFKTGSVWAFDQTLGAFEFVPTVVDSWNGCVATKSVKVVDGLAFWFSGTAVFMSDGRSPGVDITTDVLGNLASWAGTPPGTAIAAIHPTLNWYIVGSIGNSTIYCFDYQKQTWHTLVYSTKTFSGTGLTIELDYPLYFSEIKDVYGRSYVLAGFVESGGGAPKGGFFDLLSTLSVDGDGDLGGVGGYAFTAVQIPSAVRFRGLDFGLPTNLKALSRVLLACNDPQVTLGKPDANANLVSISAELDEGKHGTTVSRSGVTLTTKAKWKNIGLSTRITKASTFDVTITRDSRWALNIEGIQFHGEVWGWIPKEA